MMQHQGEALTIARGEARALPDTLAGTRDLSLSLIESDAGTGTAVLELHNPQATPDAIVAGLVEEHAADVEEANRLRDKLHLKEKAVPVDTSTAATEVLHCRLHERLQLGDRVWTITEVTDTQVTLTPGHDHETHTLLNAVEDEEFSPEVIAAAEALNELDQGL